MSGRQKGNKAEREVAGKIEKWWRRVEPEARFVRTPLSGGWGGPDLRAGFNASGDLMTTAKHFPFAVEVKRREGWSLENFKAGRACPAWQWWWQTQEAAAEMRKVPMLWLRHNREDWHVVVPFDYVLDSYMPEPDKRWTDLRDINVGKYEPAMYLVHNFLQIDPSILVGPVQGVVS